MQAHCHTRKTKWLISHLLGAVLLLHGCAAREGDPEALRSAASPQECSGFSSTYSLVTDQAENYRIQPGDQLAVGFYLSPEFNSEITVRPDGRISMPVVGDVEAKNLTPLQLEAVLNHLYSRELRDPRSTVTVKTSPGQVVYVQGEVAKPGAVALVPGMTAIQAIAVSGGLTDNANPKEVVLIKRDPCGQPYGEALKLDAALTGRNEDVALSATDVLVVPRSTIAKLDLFVKQYIRDMMPVQPYIAPTF